MSTINTRLQALRNTMKTNSIDAYIVPSTDPHQSEYVAEHWLGREWISGFTGSAGTVVVTHDHAGLWTDGRYFIQAEEQLSSSEFELHKLGTSDAVSHSDWLCDTLTQGNIIGVDGFNFSLKQLESLEEKLTINGLSLKANVDLLKDIWTDRPSLPTDKIFLHPAEFVDQSCQQKLNAIKAESDADIVLLSALDDIAWALNLRGYDVDFNPVFVAYLMIGEQTTLYVNENKITTDISTYLVDNDIAVRPYDAIIEDLTSLNENVVVSIDPTICSYALAHHIDTDIIHEMSPARMLKAVKSTADIAHIRRAMERDAVALIKSFMWLEANKANGVSEFAFSEIIAKHRSEQAHYYGESFPAIVGYKGNGAIIHYRPLESSCATIKDSGVLLCDSGGQYFDGTTDITRTLAMGDDVSDETKQAYTLVLKGMIDLSIAKFPVGTIGGQLDAFARKHLWNAGLNYLHGTGHGVGYFMNVHEPPQGFTAGMSTRSNSTLKVGMITSNEPGYYKADEYGIRIENLVVCKESDIEGFLEHETLTLMPIDRNMMDISLLTSEEINWLDDYHQMVFDRVSPLLNEEEKTWLAQQCTKL